jgi:undecaprenyl-diphosphatase
MDYTLAVLLGVVQGVTEFLPISSDGHLAISVALYEAAKGTKVPDVLGLEIVLHAGTLAAIVAFYWRRIWRLLGEDRRVIGLIFVGTLPAAIIGLPLHKWGGEFLTDPLLAGCMLPLTGLLLLVGASRPAGETQCRQLGYGRALVIGIFQALAILPGISRSGTTISAGLALGLRRDEAATFSFLLAIPAVGGACLLELIDLVRAMPSGEALGPMAVGALVSLVAGLFALAWLIKWLQQGRIQYFAWWCIPVGFAVVAWQLYVRFAGAETTL